MPQVVKIWLTKSADDVSYLMFGIFSVGIVLWLAYGIALGAMPIIVANIVTLVLSLMVIALKVRYGRRPKRRARDADSGPSESASPSADRSTPASTGRTRGPSSAPARGFALGCTRQVTGVPFRWISTRVSGPVGCTTSIFAGWSTACGFWPLHGSLSVICSGRMPSSTSLPTWACRPATLGRRRKEELPAPVVQLHARAAVAHLDRAADEVHRRRADEAGDEQVGRIVVDLLRRADLADLAVLHHHDAIAQRHRLDLVVGHVHDRGLDALVQQLDLGAHVHAQLRVEVRQRLVEQEQRRVAGERPAHGDALALAARQLRRLAVEQVLHLQRLRDARQSDPPSAAASAPCGCAGRTGCSRARSWSDTARRTGTPWRCRDPSGGRSFTTRPPMAISPSVMRVQARDHVEQASTCRSPRAPPG